MGKKSKSAPSLGRALIKDRFGASRGRRGDVSMLHTTEIEDGYDWGRLNLQSVTEESSFQEFLSTAELASTEFQAEKLNITFVNPLANVGILSKEQRESVEKSHEEHKGELQIPRRPQWDANTTAEQLDALEKQSFLEWRRRLAMLQEAKGLLLTPYEKNLEFWRQLWRVVERSDVVVQIVDARRPLLFRCPDLETYVKEVSENKINLILINKADYLTVEQRSIWANYFAESGVRVAFFSATLAAEEIKEEDEAESSGSSDEVGTSEDESCTENETETKDESNEEEQSTPEAISDNSCDKVNKTVAGAEKLIPASESSMCSDASEDFSPVSVENTHSPVSVQITNSPELLSHSQLISFLKNLHHAPKVTEGITTVGLVGYPNVGKSSTINSLMADKKVSVSATPGKTKHFQTLYLDQDILLCDCPGLVMPSFVATRAEMVLNGILPIDQLRDHVEPINLLSFLIPRHVLEDAYGIMLPSPPEGEDPHRPPTPQELLNAYGYNRGFMTHKGIPDNPRAARFILKDFVNGKLLHCSAPPGTSQELFHTFPERQRRERPAGSTVMTPQGARIMRPNKVTTEDLDKVFFKKANLGAHSKGRLQVHSGATAADGTGEAGGKPWKKHNNRHKKEKLRRIYGHLDA